ncbi:MAG TPA: tagaturonate reductase [Chitinophagaceae bacterium]|nr:tagaturonate reductase [Chitinophagaceae bacterium]
MYLSQQAIKDILPNSGLTIPNKKIFSLPEKVLQFGTGVLLRGLPDYFIDKANRNGEFNGRIVVVKSTSQGSADAFDRQDGLYTLYVKGIENGITKEEAIINSSISRVLSAKEQWADILQCAHNPEIKIIISNTTEVGIVLTDDNITLSPPHSFPGKLLAFLYERYKSFYGRDDSGMVIIPTELIIDNGSKLRSIVIELAHKNKLGDKFIGWLQSANQFCNSLVDRIVPGKLGESEIKTAVEQLGYTDDLMIMAEPFRLWVIESGSERVREILSFSKTDEGVVITPDIEKFRELKLRLLNGTHTFSCGLAFLAGFETVREAMMDEKFAAFVRQLMLEEIAEALDNNIIAPGEAHSFAMQVADRFRNPFLDHKWISIAMNYTSKMKTRNVPLLVRYYQRSSRVPANMAMGFAAFILFMKCKAGPDDNCYGEAGGKRYAIQDEMATRFAEKWANNNNIDTFADSVLGDKQLWDIDLSTLEGFAKAVKENLAQLERQGVMATMTGKQIKTVA